MVGAVSNESYLNDHHDILVANCLAQSEALMLGLSMAEVIERLELSQKKEQTLSLSQLIECFQETGLLLLWFIQNLAHQSLEKSSRCMNIEFLLKGLFLVLTALINGVLS